MALTRRAFCILAVGSLPALSACGFHLRGSQGEANLPFKTLYLDVAESSPLGIELKRTGAATPSPVR